jgi:hypothetical protein
VWLSPDVVFSFNLTKINTRFQREYQSFLTVCVELDDEDTSEESECLHV